MSLTAVEFCAGGGGQALGLEMAGFECLAAVEIDADCCTTLRMNRPQWDVRQDDMREVNGTRWRGADLFAAGVPCPPFSVAGKQLGADDDRDMFPTALRLISEIQPKAILLENVPGFSAEKFSSYRQNLFAQLARMGYQADWRILEAADYGVPQLRPRFILAGFRGDSMQFFQWPQKTSSAPTVGQVLSDLMGEEGWPGVRAWAQKAGRIAPTIVGGSKKHGGPDLGPTRAKMQWRSLGVDGMGIANAAPSRQFDPDGLPRLTVRMVARIQSFPDEWIFSGRKTASYRQVGNAFPPLVARAVGQAIASALRRHKPYPIAPARAPVQMQLLEKRPPFSARKTQTPARKGRA